MTEREKFQIAEDGRLDVVLTQFFQSKELVQQLSRSQIKHLIEKGNVCVNGNPVTKAGFLVSANDEVTVLHPPREAHQLPLYKLPLDILYEDEALIVIDKPKNLSMHPGAGNFETTLVNALLYHFKERGKDRVPETFSQASENSDVRPGIVHRLDKDTTGVVVVAKTDFAHRALSAQFAERSVGRIYAALAYTTPRARRALNVADEGKIDASLARHVNKRTQMAVTEKGGKRAVTHWKIRERFDYACLLELRLETGRTHQIRVHLNAVQSPLIGDQTYGDFSGLPLALKRLHESYGRQALHAESLAFNHPVSGQRMDFKSKLPPDMSALIEEFRSWKR